MVNVNKRNLIMALFFMLVVMLFGYKFYGISQKFTNSLSQEDLVNFTFGVGVCFGTMFSVALLFVASAFRKKGFKFSETR